MYYWYYDIVNDISIQSKASQRDFNISEVVEKYSEKYETIIPVHKDSMKGYINQLKGKEECNCEIKLKDDKKDRWLNIRYKVICDTTGNPIKISEKIIYSTIASEYDYVAYVDGINEEYEQIYRKADKYTEAYGDDRGISN